MHVSIVPRYGCDTQGELKGSDTQGAMVQYLIEKSLGTDKALGSYLVGKI